MGKNSAYATELRLRYSKLCETSKYSNPIVSIIVPAYNVANYIERCLLSLVQQSFKNIEIIVIDDGSEDMTSEIIDAFGSMDSRLVVIHQQNRGVFAARNASLYTVEDTQRYGLCKVNNALSIGMSPATATERILEKYPQAYELIERESIKNV